MQTHETLPLITCVHYDLFQKAGYLCYCFNGSRTQFPLEQSVSQSVIWESGGIVGDCQAPIPHAGCRCGGGQAHAPGTEELCVCGVGVHVPGEAWTHHISLELLLYTHTMSGSHGATHTHTHTHTHSNTQKARLLFLSVHMPLWPAHWPGVIRAVSEADKCCFSTRHHLGQAVTREHPSNRCPHPQRFLYPAIC